MTNVDLVTLGTEILNILEDLVTKNITVNNHHLPVLLFKTVPGALTNAHTLENHNNCGPDIIKGQLPEKKIELLGRAYTSELNGEKNYPSG